MLEYDSISTLKDDIIIMKNEIKKLTAVTFSALGILACSSASFCKGSSGGCFTPNNHQRKSKKDISMTDNPNSWITRAYTACPDDEIEINTFHGNLKQLIYPINTFDVNRFHRIIYLNGIDATWDIYMADSKCDNPIYGFYIVFSKGSKSITFKFNPMEAPEKFSGSTWGKEDFNLKTFFDNFEKFVDSFGYFIKQASYPKISESTVFQVPIEMTCLSRETFRNFSNLKRIVIPSTVEKVSSDTFEDCKNLESIFYLGKNYLSVEEFMKDFVEFNEFLKKNSEIIYLDALRSSFNLKA